MLFIIKPTENTLKRTYFINLLPATIAYWITPSITIFATVTQYCSYYKQKQTYHNKKIINSTKMLQNPE